MIDTQKRLDSRLIQELFGKPVRTVDNGYGG